MSFSSHETRLMWQEWEGIVCAIFTAAILQVQYLINSWRSLKNKKYSLDGAANRRRSFAQNDYFLVQHEEVPGSNPGRGKILYYLRYLLIEYYIHYNKLLIYEYLWYPYDVHIPLIMEGGGMGVIHGTP